MITIHKAERYTAIHSNGFMYIVNTGYVTVEASVKYILPRGAEVRYVGKYLTMYCSEGVSYSGIALEASDLLGKLKIHSGTGITEELERALALC